MIVVDQMRGPQWFPEHHQLITLLPNIGRLQMSSVSFESHYTASNMCTPSRGVMTTGLYSHQTGCLFTGEGPSESSLAPKFPTWGTMLRQQGYHTWWWGKWHLGHPGDTTPEGLEAHGFSGGTFPSPNGSPNQGLRKDPSIVDQFCEWFDDNAGKGLGARPSRWSIRTIFVGGRKTLCPRMFRTGSPQHRSTSRHPRICVGAVSHNCRSTT
ncbi:sulfatase family protein [Mycobacterium xenopi 3993]|nr:sulfatase family protein [Mycobacterium xenopi 3993]